MLVLSTVKWGDFVPACVSSVMRICKKKVCEFVSLHFYHNVTLFLSAVPLSRKLNLFSVIVNSTADKIASRCDKSEVAKSRPT
jgi:hypothetical protein